MSFIQKLKSTFGSSKNADSANASAYIDAIIADLSEHEPLAISDWNVLYAGLNELGGYYFFQTVIVGQFKIKSKTGAQLQMNGKDFELELTSDSLEFESDPTDVKNRWITKIDFQIEDIEAKALDRKRIEQLSLHCKSKAIQFKTIQDNKT